MDKLKLWWAGLDKKGRKRATIAAVVGAVIVLALLGNCSGA